jgi:chromate transporter
MHVQSALRGAGAAVVGLLLAALYDPLWTRSIQSTIDMALGLLLFGLLMFWKMVTAASSGARGDRRCR